MVDASTVLAALLDDKRHGHWALDILRQDDLVAPHLMPVEVTHAMRRYATQGGVNSERATLAHADLGGLTVEHHAFTPFADRVWELRQNVSSYDAWYVALAEALDVPLATLDQRLVRSDGPECAFLTPA